MTTTEKSRTDILNILLKNKDAKKLFNLSKNIVFRMISTNPLGHDTNFVYIDDVDAVIYCLLPRPITFLSFNNVYLLRLDIEKNTLNYCGLGHYSQNEKENIEFAKLAVRPNYNFNHMNNNSF